eukprot:21967-Eustigmatos_ZCMA.PRE.1
MPDVLRKTAKRSKHAKRPSTKRTKPHVKVTQRQRVILGGGAKGTGTPTIVVVPGASASSSGGGGGGGSGSIFRDTGHSGILGGLPVGGLQKVSAGNPVPSGPPTGPS